MGCLIELIGEIFIEFFLEVIFCCYGRIARMIIPEHKISHKAAKRAESIVKCISALLFIVMITGIFILLTSDPNLCFAGSLMSLIPFCIFVIVILAGIISKIIQKIKKR